MANSSVPKHDFAPAWLKIPGGDAQKPSGVNGEHRERLSRRDDRTNGKSLCVGRQRQSSFDQQYPRREGRGDAGSGRPHHHASYRHHSIDVDESQYYSCGLEDYHQIAGYRQFGSQPSLNRRPLSRQENPFNYAAAYKGYSLYDFSSDNYRNNSNNHSWSQGRQHRFECNKEVALNPDVPKKDNTADRFNQEFPSLKGDSCESSCPPPVSVNGGVWDNVRNAKVYLNSSNKQLQMSSSDKAVKAESGEVRSGSPGSLCSNAASSNGGGSNLGNPKPNPPTTISKANSQNQLTNSMYRSLVPSKTSLIRKCSKESFRITSPVVLKSSRQSSPTPPLEILNARLVTHPRNLGNKSDFLKTLRSESDKSTAEEEEEEDEDAVAAARVNGMVAEAEEEEVAEKDGEAGAENAEEPRDESKMEEGDYDGRTEVNGMNCKRVADEGGGTEKPVLSSSLEAEQRLLREMGWKEEGSGDEDDVYAPLTEDEMREFENLSKKISQQRNGLQRAMQATWSPKRAVPFNGGGGGGVGVGGVGGTSVGAILSLDDDDDDDAGSTTSSDSE